MDQAELHRTGLWAKSLWNLAGTACLAVGALGLLVPVLPTTPFLLLAAGCYLRGSARMHHWLMTNRHFGATLAAYRAGQGVPARTKVAAIASLWLGIGVSAGLLVETPAIRIMLLAIGAAVTVHLVMLPTMRSTNGSAPCGEARGRLGEVVDQCREAVRDADRHRWLRGRGGGRGRGRT